MRLTFKLTFIIVATGLLLAASMFLAACSSVTDRSNPTDLAPAPFPPVKLAVLSDIHVYDPALGVSSTDWKHYMRLDRKLLAEGLESLDTALDSILANQPELLFVSGDLTKDGEEHNHRIVAGRLAAAEAKGLKVFVIPGNHDLLNPSAKAFGDEGTTAIPSVSPAEFAGIYGAFGYDEALMRDPGSLSYLAEASPGLYLLAIDSCRYAENTAKTGPIVGGRIDGGRADFIQAALDRTARDGKAIIAMMHHGLAEHYADNKKYFPDYVVADNARVAAQLARGGVRLVLTGHFHASDITQVKVPARNAPAFFLPVWDIETGSMVTWPSPWRLIELNGYTASVKTNHVDNLPSFAARGINYGEYSREFTRDGLTGIAVDTMHGLGVPVPEAESLAPQITEAFLAHYAGDEVPPADPNLRGKNLSLMGSLVVAVKGPVVHTLWFDLSPADNNLVIDIRKP